MWFKKLIEEIKQSETLQKLKVVPIFILTKGIELIIVSSIIMSYAMYNGYVTLNPSPHRVEDAIVESKNVQKLLDVVQATNDVPFVGNFRFHNGVASLSGFNFIKSSLTEYSTRGANYVNVASLQSIPIFENISMLDAFMHNKCYTSPVRYKGMTLSVPLINLGASYIVGCPISGKTGQLVGYVLAGSLNPPSDELVDRMTLLATEVSINSKINNQ